MMQFKSQSAVFVSAKFTYRRAKANLLSPNETKQSERGVIQILELVTRISRVGASVKQPLRRRK